MPRGQPDYGVTTETSVASGISDPGEAVARLGSINIYDRRGWTVWMDDFEAAVLKWDALSNAGGTLPILSTAEAWMGIQSAFLTTAAAAVQWASIEKDFPLIRRGRIGTEFFVLLYTDATNYLRYTFNIYDGVNRTQGDMRLNFAAKTVEINTPGGWEIIASNCFNAVANNTFLPIKLVMDIDTDFYVRLLIGPDEYDISAHQLVLVGVTNDRLLNQLFQLNGSLATVHTAYIENYILTQNEP